MKTIKIGTATLIHGDCEEFMKDLPDKSFDLAVVDPPYGIKASSGSSTNGSMRKKIANGEIKGGNWDDAVPKGEYFDQLLRSTKNQVIWGGNYFSLPPSKCFLIWDKGESIYNRDFAECEMAWASFDKCARILKLNPNQADRFHPTQKPVKLYEWILDRSAKPGQTILDTHGGSMSSVIAALNMGFEITCIEKDEDYFNAAVERVIKSQQQQKLF